MKFLTLSLIYFAILLSFKLSTAQTIAVLMPSKTNLIADKFQENWLKSRKISLDTILVRLLTNLTKTNPTELKFTPYQSAVQPPPEFKLANRKIPVLPQFIRAKPTSLIGRVFHKEHPRLKVKCIKDKAELSAFLMANSFANPADYALLITCYRMDNIVQFFPVSKNKTHLDIYYQLIDKEGKQVLVYKHRFTVNWKEEMFTDVFLHYNKQLAHQLVKEIESVVKKTGAEAETKR